MIAIIFSGNDLNNITAAVEFNTVLYADFLTNGF
jgi:hypothetical protein